MTTIPTCDRCGGPVTGNPVDGFESLVSMEEVEQMRTALEKIKAHHERLNAERGRPATSSLTIHLCLEGLGRGNGVRKQR